MKEVIFHFFPSARFLGLGLKILFHKNKEIKRMLSKKMTFSLMSLITLLAFAFVAGDAFSAEKPFEITITGPTTATSATTNGQITVDLIVESALTIPALSAADGGNVTVVAIDRRGFVDDVDITVADNLIAVYPMRTAKKRQLRITLPQAPDTVDGTTGLIEKIIITIPAGLKTTDPTILATDGTDTKLDESKRVQHTITLSIAPTTDQLTNIPKVVSIQRLRPGSQSVVAAFQEDVVTDPSFNVRIVLTEHPNGPDPLNAANLIEVENGVPSNLVAGVLFAQVGSGNITLRPHPSEGEYDYNTDVAATLGLPAVTGTVGDDVIPPPTSSDSMYRQYRVTITPHAKKGDPDKTFNVKVKVKNFHDNGSAVRNTYVSPGFGESANLPNGREILTVKVAYTAVNLKAGYRVAIPKEKFIPGGGYLIVAKSKGDSEVDTRGQDADRIKDAPRATFRTPAQMLYNVEQAALPNLATAFQNGVVVDVESGNKLYITEVMWGEDVSLNPSSNSQYIELYNPGAGFNTPDDDASTPDIDERLTLVFYAPNEFSSVAAKTAVAATATATATMALPGRVTDRIGTLDATGAYWSPAGKGQTGRSGTGEAESGAGRTGVAIVPIVSMYRGMVPDTSTGAAVGAMMPDDGQMAASWISSAGPKSANFDPTALGIRHGTPGAATDATDTPADTAAEAKAKADAAAAAVKKVASTGTMPEDGQIYISEIMFAGGGILPQWIEISNGSRSEEINLSGWTLTVDNAAADADVSIGATATFTISDGTTIDMSGQQKSPSTILVVTEAGRNNVDGSGQVLDLMKSNEVDLILAGVVTRKYTLLSGMAFMVTIAPPEPEATKPPADETAGAKATRQAADKKAAAKRKAATDMVGNLGADGAAAWALPMSEDGRSSIIRRHVQVAIGAAAPDDGTMMDSWVLASETSFAAPTHIRAQSYYGAANDVGTPGFRAGGALPVELSHFRPARDKVTGAVVITWSTQSELNNAGFFIKRSQQRDGEFKVINATMIAGAGTISEKQFYTYQDTTASPNVVYYYQIEDVSLDGNRQTLTNGIRLKGHVSVAGKLTTLWGDLKTSQ